MLYISLVRSHLEFAFTVWNPYLKGDIEKLERIQKGHKNSDINKRSRIRGEIEDVGLTTLEKRRMRGDLIEMYKVHNQLENRYSSCTKHEYQSG